MRITLLVLCATVICVLPSSDVKSFANLQFENFANNEPDDLQTDNTYWRNDNLWGIPNYYPGDTFNNGFGKQSYGHWGRHFKTGWRRACRSWCGFLG